MNITKMHGAGNDYVYIDCFSQDVPDDLPELARQISHRHFGVGGDGLVLIRKSDQADARMQMFNADGSESEMCGNAIRCVAKFMYDHGIKSTPNLKIETGAGILSLDCEVGGDGLVSRVKVDMGPPELHGPKIPTTLPVDPDGRVVESAVEFDGKTFPVTCVSMGNPHCVIFVPDATDELVLGLGPKIENDPRFPNRINVEFVEVLSRNEVRQRTWERGSGETWACGTGAAAVCVAGVLSGRTERTVLNHLLGGDLTLTWDEASGHVIKTGPATEVFSGQWNR
ncbi:diaminopimelate epimerase [Roseiconus lacunae]|uniref:diaminopimelate epimerase n=1 Tax=Roseiconus lacunae TaxID=2605694 RepID=UPI0011F11CD3|nr:diaminopimelate epimerase [Roseiconus lacunae]MCD0461310.1 diaminopimelate epimerase [Roseiconus lacunae]WRQ51529.1 diaminopimelate epimerase [Stieleria sp. HD01]